MAKKIQPAASSVLTPEQAAILENNALIHALIDRIGVLEAQLGITVEPLSARELAARSSKRQQCFRSIRAKGNMPLTRFI